MDLKTFFEVTGGDYDEVMSRIGTEQRIIKYLRKFQNVTDYDDLLKALEEKDYETAFRAVHSIKGMCLNLGVGKLGQSSHVLCEELRNGEPKNDITMMLEQVGKDFTETIDAIGQIEE